MKKYYLFFTLLLVSTPLLAQAITVAASKHYFERIIGTANHDDYLILDAQITFDDNVSPGQRVGVSSFVQRSGRELVRDYTITASQSGQIGFNPSTFSGLTTGVGNFGLTSSQFVAPSSPGTYTVSFGINESPTYTAHAGMEIVLPVTYRPGSALIRVDSFECSDGINNDGQQGTDSGDPQCHTDCNATNPGTYNRNHPFENMPPSGGCPTLGLIGREVLGVSLLQATKNFFATITSKAFAGE